MSRPVKQLSLLLVMSLCAAAVLWAEGAPKPLGRINDYANVIPDEYRQKLEDLIREVDEKTSDEIAIVAVESMGSQDEKSYSRTLFDTWKIGKRGKDNGILLLLAVKERRWRIETGYGLEGILPDGRCGEIGRTVMVPLFRVGKYGEGLYKGTLAIADVIAKDAGLQLDSLKADNAAGVTDTGAQTGTRTNPLLYIIVPVFFFAWNLSWPVYIGLPVTIFFAIALSTISPLMPYFVMGGYLASMVARYSHWKNLPPHKRNNFFGTQDYTRSSRSGSRGWGIGSGFSGGGFGGGGFGGGFGGGGGGGGGAGGGF